MKQLNSLSIFDSWGAARRFRTATLRLRTAGRERHDHTPPIAYETRRNALRSGAVAPRNSPRTSPYSP